MYKRLLTSVLTVCVAITVSTALYAGGAKETGAAPASSASSSMPFKGQTLTVSTWGFNMDLIKKNITQPFEEKYGVKVVYELGNNAPRLTKLVAKKDNPDIDVVQLAGNYSTLAIADGVLQPYNPAEIPNLSQLYSWAKDPLGNKYGVGYAISSLLLAYRTDKITTPITSWNDLLNPAFKGDVSIPDITTTFGPATVVLLARANGGSQDNVEPAWTALKKLAPNLTTVYTVSSQLVSLVQQGEVWIAPYSSFSWGDLVATGVPLKSVVPKEGVVGSQSVVSVVKGAKHPDLANAYINFLISKEVQTAEAMDLVDSPTNSTVTVPPDIASKLTYGPEIINHLIFLDDAKMASQQDSWIKRWNSIISK
ncbi:MAG TPA: ABC transporter substrate-binding protein [Spirochaetia bacterium]|nr:ABC transporter substrate-binding protein [Spirochaetia bacterium]